MVLVAAVALGSSTYAWFAANNKVTAMGMTVQAQSEGGIVISNESKTDWKTSATASHQEKAQLMPTSTATTTSWYHNISDDAADAKAHQAADTYSTLTLTVNDKGVGADTSGNGYYLLNKFYIKSSAEAVADGKIYIQNVTATGSSTSAKLDTSLRVAITIGGGTYIYAPVNGATLTYYVNGASSATTATNATSIVNTETAVSGIPANLTTEPLEACVYIYFEGEDAECKSENITSTLDSLQLTIDFGTVEAQTT